MTIQSIACVRCVTIMRWTRPARLTTITPSMPIVCWTTTIAPVRPVSLTMTTAQVWLRPPAAARATLTTVPVVIRDIMEDTITINGQTAERQFPFR